MLLTTLTVRGDFKFGENKVNKVKFQFCEQEILKERKMENFKVCEELFSIPLLSHMLHFSR